MIEQIKQENDTMYITLSGKIYVEEATAVREKLFPCLDQGYKHFVFDMSRVTFIDSSGLGVLVAIQKRALQNRGGVRINGLKGEVKELFELTRLNQVFQLD